MDREAKCSTASGTPWPSASAGPDPGSPRAASTPTRSPARSPRSAPPSAPTTRSRLHPDRAAGPERRPRPAPDGRRASPSPPASLPGRPAGRDRRAGRRASAASRSAPTPPCRAARRRSTRTDPVVGAVAALRPVRRPGPARPDGASGRPAAAASSAPAPSHQRTTLLLVRYRFQLVLPGRYGDTAADRRGRPRARLRRVAREPGLAGRRRRPRRCSPPTPDANTAPEFARAARSAAILDGLAAGAARGEPPRRRSSPPNSARRTAGSAAAPTRPSAA